MFVLIIKKIVSIKLCITAPRVEVRLKSQFKINLSMGILKVNQINKTIESGLRTLSRFTSLVSDISLF